MDVVVTSPADPRVRELLERHLQLMRDTSPPESCHVMDPEELSAADARMLAVFDKERALGVGAFKAISQTEAELKSMHTSTEARGRGVARLILQALIKQARAAGYRRVSLETGSQPEFHAAQQLYLREGFAVCLPFGSYTEDPLSVFMTREI
jgi:putative acetyltransferase